MCISGRVHSQGVVGHAVQLVLMLLVMVVVRRLHECVLDQSWILCLRVGGKEDGVLRLLPRRSGLEIVGLLDLG